MNKLVLFDMGGVLCDIYSAEYNYKCCYEDAIKVLTGKSVSYDELMSDFVSTPYVTTGDDMEPMDFYNKVLRPMISKVVPDTRVDFSMLDKFQELFDTATRRLKMNEEVEQYAYELRGRYADVGILSNCNVIQRKFMTREADKLGIPRKYLYLSYIVGYAKPNIKLFNRIDRSLDIFSEDIFLVDDCKANIEAAAKVGWRGIVYSKDSDIDEVKESIEKFLKD